MSRQDVSGRARRTLIQRLWTFFSVTRVIPQMTRAQVTDSPNRSSSSPLLHCTPVRVPRSPGQPVPSVFIRICLRREPSG